MKRIFLLFTIVLLSHFVNAQVTILGTITGQAGEPLVGASIYILDSRLGTTSNSSGFYKLSLAEGTHILGVDYIGYKSTIDTIALSEDMSKDYRLKINPFLSDEFVVEATRVNNNLPFTFQDISKEEIEQNNLGQDLPILLNQTVSAVTTSDAGAGVGYTGIRIRGSDATRINVTVNGVPINDAESHGVFWVNMPDFASTTNSIQIQRGVGTSSNGAAAFGASINLQTTGFDSTAFVEFNNSYGSFNTHRHNVIYNSGLVSKHFNFEGRLSYIGSDGYIDRSASNLRSYYVAGGYYRKKLMIKGVVFSGKEITQQAWWGTPQSRVEGDDASMIVHAANNGLSESQTENLLSSGRTYNYYTYKNEIDNYTQSHYQLISGFQINQNLYLNITGHYTRGLGFFEQFKEDAEFSDFGLNSPIVGTDTFTNSNVVVRRWLDNHFYGGVYSLQYDKGIFAATMGGSYNEYIGDHFGEIIWAEFAQDLEKDQRYYNSESKKADFSNYVKASLQLNNVTLLADVQYRHIDYTSAGLDNDQRPIKINRHYNFINPKLGLNLQLNSENRLYVSVARASREPVRSDFTDAAPGATPLPEFLTNGELGWNVNRPLFSFGANAYFMYYTDQLVLTGEVNDVGSPVRTNVDESYRAGLELDAIIGKNTGLYWQPNLSISQNKILEFEETILDYTNGYEVIMIKHENTDIAFSPSIISGSQLGFRTKFGLQIAVISKFVGRQFLDNTSNRNRSIDPFWTTDALINYQVNSKHWKNLELTLLVNNVFSYEYESNGYTYSYIYSDLVTENFYYPQATVNWLAGLKWRF